MQFLFVFPNKTKWKNANVSKTDAVSHVIYMIFGSSLGKIKFHTYAIFETDFLKVVGLLGLPYVSSPKIIYPE